MLRSNLILILKTLLHHAQLTVWCRGGIALSYRLTELHGLQASIWIAEYNIHVCDFTNFLLEIYQSCKI